MIKAVIFDFAGVLSSEAYLEWLAANFEIDNEKKEFFNGLSHKVDKGLISESEFLDVLSKESGKTPEAVKAEIFSLIKLRPEILGLVASLKGAYKVGLLTNYCKEWMHYLVKKHSFNRLFDALVISSDIGTIKPERRIYEETAGRLGVDMQECVFVDDRQVNVDAASNYGMKAILYTTFDKLQGTLAGLGVRA